MIKYNLICKCGHTFESWFSASSEFERLRKKKLVTCILCNSYSVKKTIMAPNISSNTKKNYALNKREKNIRRKLLEFRNFVEKNCKYVGDRFSEEVRSIHYDNKDSKGIYGKATPEETAELINSSREKKRRIITVGTSTVRALETVVVSGFQVTQREGWTDKFIYPPYEFKMSDMLITNFHQPQSTLMMLVSAYANKDFIMHAYKEAIKKKYRFYSYGDAMLIM